MNAVLKKWNSSQKEKTVQKHWNYSDREVFMQTYYNTDRWGAKKRELLFYRGSLFLALNIRIQFFDNFLFKNIMVFFVSRFFSNSADYVLGAILWFKFPG